MDAIVLAGRANDGKLKDISNQPNEALIDIAGQPMLQYIVDALAAAKKVERAVVVGPEALLRPRLRVPDKVFFAEPGVSIIDNLKRGIAALPDSRQVAVVTGDLPLVTGDVIDGVIDECLARPADLYYPILSKETLEAKYGGTKRTYVKLREGTFTGANVFVLSPATVASRFPQAEAMIAARKDPLKMASVLGLSFVFKFLFNRLSIPDLERTIGRSLNLTGLAVISSYPEIGIDVDKPSDYEFVNRVLSERKKLA